MAGHHTCEIQSLTIKFKSGSTELLVGSQRGNDFHQMNLAGHACVMINLWIYISLLKRATPLVSIKNLVSISLSRIHYSHNVIAATIIDVTNAMLLSVEAPLKALAPTSA